MKWTFYFSRLIYDFASIFRTSVISLVLWALICYGFEIKAINAYAGCLGVSLYTLSACVSMFLLALSEENIYKQFLKVYNLPPNT